MKKGSSLEYVVLVEFREKRTVLLASSSGSSSKSARTIRNSLPDTILFNWVDQIHEFHMSEIAL